MYTTRTKKWIISNKMTKGIELTPEEQEWKREIEKEERAKCPSQGWRDIDKVGRPRAGQWVLLMDKDFKHVAMGIRQKNTDIYWIAKGTSFANPGYYMTKEDLLNIPTT